MSSKPYRDSQEPFRFSRQRSPDSTSIGSRYSDPFDDANGSTTTLVPATQDASANPRPPPERSRPTAPQGPRKKESYASSLRTLAFSLEDDDDGKDVVDLFPSPTHQLKTSDKKDLGQDEEDEDPEEKTRKSRTDRHLSNLYSLYRRDTTQLNSRLSYLPRIQSSRHQRNDSQATLISSNASHLDIDLEKQQTLKLGFTDEGKPLPETPPTPTPRRVLRRAGICTGLCCFCFLILVAICSVSFMMIMVNANLDNWGTSPIVLPMGPIERQRVAASKSTLGVAPTKSLLFDELQGPQATTTGRDTR